VLISIGRRPPKWIEQQKQVIGKSGQQERVPTLDSRGSMATMSSNHRWQSARGDPFEGRPHRRC
jgi:hypothetical protein